MVNKPQAIGTSTETSVVKYARTFKCPFNGYEKYQQAKRLQKTGALDVGDVWLAQGLIAQVKGGHMAEQATREVISGWWLKSVSQALNYASLYNEQVHVFLILKKKNIGLKNPGSWLVYYSQDTATWPVQAMTFNDYLSIWGHQSTRKKFLGEPMKVKEA